MNAEQNELLRHAIREALVIRHPTAHAARAIRRAIANEVDFQLNEADVINVCEFLVGLGQLQKEPDPLGSTIYYSATPAGVLAHERGK